MRKRSRAAATSSSSLSVVHSAAAGIDIGAREVWVAVPAGRSDPSVRCFETFTADLQELAGWLREVGITTVAMESTGVYWIPLFQILEAAGFQVCLVNARHVQKVPGRKSDVLDCQWLQRLHEAGLLQASFRPPEAICAIRSILRHRANLVTQAAAHLQAMQKALTEMNIHLHHVLSDLAGTSGLRIVDAVLAGERHPETLAALREPRCKTELATVVKALQGDWRPEHLFVLRQARAAFRYVHTQLDECDREIEKVLLALEGKAAPDERPPAALGKQQRPRKNQIDLPNADLRTELFRLYGTDLTQVPGLGVATLLQLYGELGADLSAFPTAKHFSSWLALCPGNRRSGGKILSSRTRPVKHRVATLFRVAVQTLHHSDCWLGGLLRRLKARLGKAEGTTAAAHRLAQLFYTLVTKREAYDETHYHEKQVERDKRELKNLLRKAAARGFTLVPKT